MKLNIFFLVLFLVLTPLKTISQPWIDNVKNSDKDNFYKIQEEFNKYWKDKIPEKGRGYKQFKRWEWFWGQRVYPSGILPRPDILQIKLKEHLQKFPVQESTTIENWKIMGPIEIPNIDNDGPDNGLGRLNCVTVHPTDSNKIFVGAASGGLWKSTNGGTTWSSNTDNLGSLGVSSIVIDPNNTNIMYIATGDADGYSSHSLGVLKSTDGGSTWNQTGLNWEISLTRKIYKVIIHPTNSNILLAATDIGVFKSLNGGTNWTNVVTDLNIGDLEVNPTDPTIWYHASKTNGIYKSTNTGESFTKLTTGLPTSGFTRIAIAIAKSSPSIIYSLFVNITEGFYGLYKSTDAGATWSQQSTTPNILSWDGTGNDGQGTYDLFLDVDPIDPTILYTGGINMYKSINSGTNWIKISHWHRGTANQYVHADHHNFTFMPNNSFSIISANDGGIYKSTDRGNKWQDLSGGLAITQIYKMANSKTNPNRVYIGTQDLGTLHFLNGRWNTTMGGDGNEAIIDFTNDSIAYVSGGSGVFLRTLDGGLNWTDLPQIEKSEFSTPFVMNQKNSYSLYQGASKVYKSFNRGDSWTAISPKLTIGMIDQLQIAPSDTNIIYVSEGDSIFKTINNGISWSNIPSGVDKFITSITVHPTNPQIVYITFSGFENIKVYKSINGGSTWSNISTGLPSIPINCMVINPPNGDQIVVGTDLGVYYSSDAGANWAPFKTNLPNVIVNELEFIFNHHELRAATYGRGLWKTDFPTIINTQPSNAPQLLKPITFAQNVLLKDSLKWNSEYLASSYLVQMSTYKNFSTNIVDTTTSLLQYKIWQQQENSKIYYWRVQAKNQFGSGPFAIDSFTTIIAAPSTAPTLLKPVSNAINVILKDTLKWSLVAEASKYLVQLSNIKDFSNLIINRTITFSTYFMEENLNNNTKYYWRVKAVNNGGEGPFATDSFTTIIAAPSSAPIFIKPISNAINVPLQDTLKWSSVTRATYYIIQLSTNKDFSTKIADTNTSLVQYKIWQKQENGKKYYLFVRGLNDGGDGPYTTDSFTTIISAPSISPNLIYPKNDSTNLPLNVILKWSKVFAATKYQINISKQNNFTTFIKDTTTADSTFKSNGLEINTKYYWRVRAENVGGSGPYSEIKSFTTGINTLIALINLVPTEYTLSQNYPNPFNPSTTIRFGLPNESKVKLEIYNSLGQLFETLVDENLSAFYYEAIWDSKNIPSGLYFYKLTATSLSNPNNKFIQTRKMMLMK